jgi:hypothetical protein
MAKIDLLRKLIREELTYVIKQELPKLLSEVNKPAIIDTKKSLQESIKSKIPGTLNTSRPPVPKFTSNNPLASLLNETANSMLNEDISMTSDDVHPSLGLQPRETKVGDINSMLSTARASSNLDAVQINEVPDFSGLMNKLKQTGQI